MLNSVLSALRRHVPLKQVAMKAMWVSKSCFAALFGFSCEGKVVIPEARAAPTWPVCLCLLFRCESAVYRVYPDFLLQKEIFAHLIVGWHLVCFGVKLWKRTGSLNVDFFFLLSLEPHSSQTIILLLLFTRHFQEMCRVLFWSASGPDLEFARPPFCLWASLIVTRSLFLSVFITF